jgi:hypothetical protein
MKVIFRSASLPFFSWLIATKKERAEIARRGGYSHGEKFEASTGDFVTCGGNRYGRTGTYTGSFRGITGSNGLIDQYFQYKTLPGKITREWKYLPKEEKNLLLEEFSQLVIMAITSCETEGVNRLLRLKIPRGRILVKGEHHKNCGACTVWK